MVSALITVAVIAWCAQLALGGWQISRFNRAFDTLCQQGRVGVGRSSGRFKPPDVIFPHDPLSQNALSLALKLKRG